MVFPLRPRVLVADGDPIARRLVHGVLVRRGYDLATVADGDAAWTALEREDAPRLALVADDRPVDGLELCRRLRRRGGGPYVYVIVLSLRQRTDDYVAALEAGADDFLSKPYRPPQLHARLRVGERIVRLEHALADKVRELDAALAQATARLPRCPRGLDGRGDCGEGRDGRAPS